MGQATLFLLAASVVAASLAVVVQAAPVQRARRSYDLDSLKKAFEGQSKKIDDAAMTALLAWPEQYTAAIKALQKRLQATGNLEGWKAVDDELNRFNQDRQLTEEQYVEDFDELRAIQERFAVVPDKVHAEKRSRLAVLMQKYVNRLTAMQKKLTMAGKMEDALAVNEELSRVAPQLEEMTEKVVAEAKEAATRMREPEPEPAPAARLPPAAASSGAAAKEVAKPAPSAQGKKAPSGAKVYDGEQPPEMDDFTFKDVSISPTDRMRTAARFLSVNTMLGAKAETSKSAISRSYMRYEDRSVTAEYVVRIAIRSGSPDAAVENASLVVQYFGKDLAKQAGKNLPSQMGTETVPLPTLDASRTVTVDCAGLSMSSARHEAHDMLYWIGPNLSSTSKSGQQYYGVIVSVFDGGGKLIYQGASNKTLEKMGIGEIPRK